MCAIYMHIYLEIARKRGGGEEEREGQREREGERKKVVKFTR